VVFQAWNHPLYGDRPLPNQPDGRMVRRN
jgi:hypothetical protein